MSHFYTCQSGVRKDDLRKFLYEDEDSALFHWICCFSSCIIETHLCMCHKNMVKCLKENYIRSYSLLILLKHFYCHVCICCYACMYMQLLHFCLVYFTHSITAGIVVEYFVMAVQTTESSCPAQQSQSECVTIVTIMC